MIKEQMVKDLGQDNASTMSRQSYSSKLENDKFTYLTSLSYKPRITRFMGYSISSDRMISF